MPPWNWDRDFLQTGASGAEVAFGASRFISRRVKLVKQQINGNERVVLKNEATLEDLRMEAKRLKAQLGYQVKQDGRVNRYLATHPFFRGKFVLELETD
jgi:hypothetical protein